MPEQNKRRTLWVLWERESEQDPCPWVTHAMDEISKDEDPELWGYKLASARKRAGTDNVREMRISIPADGLDKLFGNPPTIEGKIES